MLNQLYSFASKKLTFFLLTLLLALPFTARALDQTSADALATSILAASGRHCALIAVPRCGSGELVVSFWNKVGESHAIVDGFESDPTLLASAQQKANARGLLGRNLYLRSGTLSTAAYSMPYADNLVDLVVVTNLQDSDLSGISYAEMERVLCYSGQAWIGRAASETGGTLTTGSLNVWISGTHALSTAKVVSDATGTWAVITKISRLPNTFEGGGSVTNAGSRFYPDFVATWPTLPQYVTKPYGGMASNGSGKVFNWGCLAKICVGGGRMYGFDDNNPNALCALRAQNGILLWQRPGLNMNIAGGIQPFSKGVVYGNQIIDGETGVTTGTIPIPSNWTGTVSYQVENSTATSDILYAVGRGTDGVNTLLAYDLVNKVTVYSKANFADNNVISTYYTGGMIGSLLEVVMAGGKLYACSGTSLYCYNTADGSKNWGPVAAPATPQFIEASPNGVFLQVGYSGNVNYYFFGVADGSLKWGPKAVSSPHTYCDIAKTSTLNSGNEAICTQGNGTAIDILTGTNCGAVGWYGAGSCAPGAGMTPAGFFSRRNGINYSMALRDTHVNSSDPWASDCTDSPFAASGMIIQKDKWYNCACYGVFRGTTGQAPLGTFNPEQTAVQSERLQQGPAYGNVNVQVVPDTMDWPTHRANNNRGGYVPVQIPTNKLVQLWKYTSPTQNAYDKDANEDFYTYQDVTPPVTAGNYLTGGTCYTYLAGSDGIVKCLDSSTGNLVWTYATGAWVFATPTVANGCLYVGSGDGYVYCLEAQTGRLVWKFRAAPTERRFNYFGHLISTWPVLTGVLSHTNGNVYFASGMFDLYGVQVYALNAQTGAIVWQNTKAGVCLDNRPGLARVGHFPGGYMTVVGNQLMMKEHKHGYNNQLQRIAIYDLNTGAISSQDTTFPGQSQNAYGFWTGRQIGVMGNYVFGWGEDVHTEMEYEQYGGAVTFSKFDSLGNPVRPFLILGYPNHVDAMAWDNTEAFWEAKKFKLSGANSLPQIFDNAIANPPPTSADASKLCTVCYSLSGWPATTTDSWWKPVVVSGTNRVQALTSNCLVQVSGSGDIGVLDRTTGAQYFHVNSGGEPYLQGMAVDRSGKIIVVNRTGDVVCYGTPDPAVVTQPSDVSGVENGQPATFSVEAAGQGLSYQWQFNGVAIAGATSATYSIASVSDSNAGIYNCVVANTTGTVTTAMGRLSTAVTASLTSPTDGSLFSQPGDSQSPSITLSASASSLHGTITNVEYYSSGTNLLGSSATAPYTFTWNTATPGTYSLTCKAYDSLGKTGVSQPVNITVAALVAHLALDETSGTTAHDSSGNNNNAYMGQYSTYTPSWASQSLFNGGMVNNNNSWLSTGTISSMSGTAFTIGMWVNYSSNGWGRGVIYAGGSNGGGCIVGGNYPQLFWATSGTTVASGTYHIPTYGTWYHYAVVATPTLVSWYLNGQLFSIVQPPSGQTFKTSIKNFSFGNGTMTYAPRNGAGFIGLMDEIKIYNNALSPTDVAAMYTSNIPYRLPMPTLALTSPTDGQIVSATNSLAMSAVTSGSHFPMSVKYYANGTLVGTGTTAPNYSVAWNNVARGTYAITGSITDGLGQVAASNTANVTFSYVSQPVLNLSGGTYPNAQTITVTCSDPTAEIHYTTTGLDPTMSDPVIVSGSTIPITKTTVLKVQAFKSGYQPSEIQAVIYRIGRGLAGGGYHSFALIPGAPLWAFGYNGNGQLGDGSTTNRNWPVCVGGLNNLVSVSGGGWGYHSLGVDANGAVWGWGENNYGQVGDGSATQRTSPVKLSGITNALSVSAGGYHSLAVKWDATAWAWGYNYYGQLGNSGTTNKNAPVQVLVAGSTALTNVIAVAGGDSHSLALRSDGTVWAWGANYYGQLGDGTTTSGSVAAPVTGLTGTVTAIAAGSGFSVALKSDGTVWAWGSNWYGQLGNGTTTSGSTPSQVTGLTNVAAISVSSNSSHVLALKNDGTVWAWGENSNCQLGDGTTNQHTTPFQVTVLGNIVAVGAGGYHSMALSNDGSLWAWGSNAYGGLGNNTTTTGTNPAPSMSPSNPYVVFTTGIQTVSESAPPFPVISQLFCPTTASVTVPFTTSGSAVKNTDYTISASPVVISAGQTSGSLTISPINDTVYKGSRTIIVAMGTVSGATKGIITSNTTTLTDDEPLPNVSFTSGSITANEAAVSVQIPVQLSAPAGVAVSVPFTASGTAVSGTDYTITGGTATIAAGGTTTNIAVALIRRTGYQGNRALTLTMGTPTNATIGSIGAETLTITDVDPKPLTITTPVANQSVSWGQTAAFSVVVDGSSPSYQWSRNGTPVSGATNATYTTPAAVVADNGAVFSVTATNAVSSATSSGTLSVACYPVPQIAICNPIGGVTISGAPANVTIQVAVQSPGVASVQFYKGSTLLGQTTGTSFTWNNVPAGQYAITAVVADTQGQVATSDPIYITVTAPAPAAFDDWIISHSLTGSQALECASPANDRISNLMKYALGLDPNMPCSKPTDGTNPGLPLVGIDGANLTLTYQQDTAKSDVTYTTEASTDMVTWSNSSVTETVVSSNGTVNTVKSSIPRSSGRMFMRLRVTK